jgi:hypothetical protein
MANITYYFALYFIIIVLKIFKFILDNPDNEVLKNKENIYKYFAFPLDLTFAFSGCIIALFLNVESQWFAAITALWAVLIILSLITEFLSPRFKNNLIVINIILTIVIFSTTFYLFNSVLPGADTNGKIAHNDIEETYDVVIPYRDLALEKKVGAGNIGGRDFFVVIDKVKSVSMDSAVFKAIEIFEVDENINSAPNSKLKELKINFQGIRAFPN